VVLRVWVKRIQLAGKELDFFFSRNEDLKWLRKFLLSEMLLNLPQESLNTFVRTSTCENVQLVTIFGSWGRICDYQLELL